MPPTFKPRFEKGRSFENPSFTITARAAVVSLLSLVGCGENRGTPYSGPKEEHQPIGIYVESERPDKLSEDADDALEGCNYLNVFGIECSEKDTKEEADIAVTYKEGKVCSSGRPESNSETTLGIANGHEVQICPDAGYQWNRDTGSQKPPDVPAHEIAHAGFVFDFNEDGEMNQQIHVPPNDDPLEKNSDGTLKDPYGLGLLHNEGISGIALMNPNLDATHYFTDVDAEAFYFFRQRHKYILDFLVQPKGDSCQTNNIQFIADPAPIVVSGSYQEFPGDYQSGATDPNVVPIVSTTSPESYAIQYPYGGNTIVVKPSDPNQPESASINVSNIPGAECQTAWCGTAPNATLERCIPNCTGETIEPDVDGNCTLTEGVNGNAIVVSFNGSEPIYPDNMCGSDVVNNFFPNDFKVKVSGYAQFFGDLPADLMQWSGGTRVLSAGDSMVSQRRNAQEEVYVGGLPEGVKCRVVICDPNAPTLSDCLNQCSGAEIPTAPMVEPGNLFVMNPQECVLPKELPPGSGLHVSWTKP